MRGPLLSALATMLALAACRPASPSPTTTPQPAATQTSAPTLDAPTLPPAGTPSSTLTSMPATAAGTAAPSETLAASPPPTAPAETGLTDHAEFVADVTVPDSTPFTPGTKFTKTWRVKNVGTSTWTTDYALVFVRGERLGGPDRQALATSVPPGQSVDISVELAAPASPVIRFHTILASGWPGGSSRGRWAVGFFSEPCYEIH